MPSPWDAQRQRYAERYALYRGELFIDAWRTNPYKDDPRVYKNISLLWNHTRRVVDFYATITYQGQLSAEPNSGAIPIVPDKTLTGAATDDDDVATDSNQVGTLMTAIDMLWQKWNWQKQMSIRPRLGAMLGDVLTELVDDPDYQFVYPKAIWPGYVKAIELDYVGNVRAYTLEYDITERHANGSTETYTYRKEVTEEDYRYFKDDKPFTDTSDDGHGDAVQPNPYGFVPAVWDRHTDDGLGVRGEAATDASRQALFGMNSLFSHSRDFQHKAFFAPIIVTGAISRRNQRRINLTEPEFDPETATSEEIDAHYRRTVGRTEGSAMAQQLKFLQGGENAKIQQAQFNIGQTIEQLNLMKDGILATHPEAQFFDKLADAANVTGPGADRIILPVKGLVEHARSGYDSNTVHIIQMGISMCGYRANNGDWGEAGALSRSRQVFLPYDLGSYSREEMAFTVGPREIVIPGKLEQLELVTGIESLQSPWGLEKMGVTDKKEQAAILNARAERFAMAVNDGAFGQDFGDDGGQAA